MIVTNDKPPFRADHVGSLLRPAAIRDAREKFAAGRLTARGLKQIEDQEISRVIRNQENIGLQAVTDGEFRRSWWHLDFLWGLDGVSQHVLEQGVSFAKMATRNEGVRIDGKVAFTSHPMIEHFDFVKAHTQRTPKITIPAPSAIYGRPMRTPIDATIYPDLDEFFADLGEAYRQAVNAFVDHGCRYLQLDEVFIAMLCDPQYRQQMTARGDDPERLAELYAALINTSIQDVPSDMTITMHLCRGNYRSSFMGAGGYEAVQDVLFKHKRVVLGIVTTKHGELESKEALKRRIDEAARYADLEQLCLSGQCGFASTEEGNTLSEDEQWAKLARIVEVADEVWR
jgi:5-methyltetrahydropteroyltriglutamate--homocysteine methyltransferase